MWFCVLHVILRVVVPAIIIPTFIHTRKLQDLPSLAILRQLHLSALVVPPGILFGVLVPVVVVVIVLSSMEDLGGIVVAVRAEAKCKCTCFSKLVVVASNLQLDIVHRLRAQAAVLEEQEELADLAELKTCTVLLLHPDVFQTQHCTRPEPFGSSRC